MPAMNCLGNRAGRMGMKACSRWTYPCGAGSGAKRYPNCSRFAAPVAERHGRGASRHASLLQTGLYDLLWGERDVDRGRWEVASRHSHANLSPRVSVFRETLCFYRGPIECSSHLGRGELDKRADATVVFRRTRLTVQVVGWRRAMLWQQWVHVSCNEAEGRGANSDVESARVSD